MSLRRSIGIMFIQSAFHVLPVCPGCAAAEFHNKIWVRAKPRTLTGIHGSACVGSREGIRTIFWSTQVRLCLLSCESLPEKNIYNCTCQDTGYPLATWHTVCLKQTVNIVKSVRKKHRPLSSGCCSAKASVNLTLKIISQVFICCRANIMCQKWWTVILRQISAIE